MGQKVAQASYIAFTVFQAPHIHKLQCVLREKFTSCNVIRFILKMFLLYT